MAGHNLYLSQKGTNKLYQCQGAIQTAPLRAESFFMTNKINTLTIDGISLEAKWIGLAENQKPVLVFLHEGLGCVALWRDFPEKLCYAIGLRGLVFSRQGYGASDPIPLPRPVRFMHHEGLTVLPKVLDAAGIDQAILVGHSDGGSICLINAGGARDPRVKAIVTLAAHVFNEDITVQSIAEAKIAYETTNLRERLAKYHGDNVDCAFWGWNGVWLDPNFRDWNIEEFLPDISIPALILQGEEDQYGTPAQVEAIQHGIGAPAHMRLIPDCKHSPHLEQPEITLALIADFVKSLC